ncbi:MAG: tryptophan--tRNA ligase, partial [Myxococcaceae bacterium]
DAPLYSLLQVMAPPSEFPELDKSWRDGGKGYGDFKKKLLEYYHAAFGPARARREELVKDPAAVEQIFQDGARRARELAAPYMDAVRKAVGLR